MDRNIGQVPMKSALRSKLFALGHQKIETFQPEKWEILAKDLEITEEEAKLLICTVQDYGRTAMPGFMQPMTAWDLLEKQQKSPDSIRTGCQQLNEILSSGIKLGKVTELSGGPGVGKTQLCMQLCVNVQIPTEFGGGLGGSAVYLDTDGAFVAERFHEIAQGLVDQCQAELATQSRHSTVQAALEKVTVEEIMTRIFHIRCHDYLDLVAAVHLLPEFFKQNPSIKLIVVDSVASHFRYAFEDISRRAKIMNGFMQKLTSIAIERNAAVVVTNQMTTRIVAGEDSRLVPALGTAWGYACAVRLNLRLDGEVRIAVLFKSPTRSECSAPFAIVPAGIRDVPVDEMRASQLDENDRSLLMSSQLLDNGDDRLPEDPD